MRQTPYRVYILANRSRRIYIGVTRDLARRLWQHRHGVTSGFTRRYGMSSLVYVETFADALTAIARGKQLKRWPRWRKDRLIDAANPTWTDRSAVSPATPLERSGGALRETDASHGVHGDRGSEGDPDTRVGCAAAPAG